MIGLGSNRLSVCRRGGMSVTQAGRGGMEWLAGVRYPSWSSPYSAQATAALKAQFPTQWPTIRDYGFAHPEIVGYMNAYAPEDAKLAISLVPTLGMWRRIITTGSAYFNTQVYYTGEPAVAEVDMRCTQGGYIGTIGVMQYSCPVHDSRRIVKWERIGGTCYIYEDGVLKTSVTYSNYQGYFGLLKLGQNNGWYGSNAGGHVYSAKLYKDGEFLRHYVPYVKNNVVGFLDLLSGYFDGPVSGTLTIEDNAS